MAQVMFFTSLPDKLGFAARLLRKKFREGSRVAVFGPAPLLNRLDQALWAEDPLDFVPHLRLRDAQALTPEQLARTPLWLLEQPREGLNCDSAVNLGCDNTTWLAGFERAAELIGLDDAERGAGRARWKAYEQAGHTLSHHAQSS